MGCLVIKRTKAPYLHINKGLPLREDWENTQTSGKWKLSKGSPHKLSWREDTQTEVSSNLQAFFVFFVQRIKESFNSSAKPSSSQSKFVQSKINVPSPRVHHQSSFNSRSSFQTFNSHSRFVWSAIKVPSPRVNILLKRRIAGFSYKLETSPDGWVCHRQLGQPATFIIVSRISLFLSYVLACECSF